MRQKNSLTFKQRVDEVFLGSYSVLARKTDQLFAFVLAFQWFLGIALALWISPQTWAGEESQVHIHVYAAIFLGGLLASLPIYFIFTSPGATFNRMVIATSQILYSILLIHLTGGRIETHFHVFGSLAFLAFYRDWRPVLIGTVITTVDHLVRGAFWPESVYGVLTATPWRAFEHAAWVVFEDLILFYSMRIGISELRSVSESQVKLEETIVTIEDQVNERTKELQTSQRTVLEQQQALIASSKMSALGEMAGGVAHEINTPLAAIKNLSSQIEEVLADEPVDKKLAGEMASKIVSTSDRIAKIVLGLRSFSRDGSKDAVEKVTIKQLIEDTLSFCKERFKNNGTELIVQDLHEDLFFEGRPTELSQVLLNLLNNSHDAVSNLKEKWIKISAQEIRDSIEIRVTDSGAGIDSKAQKKLFQPFFTTKEIGKGTGMGLSISLGIVRSHGGNIRLDSEAKNTCFVIQLPKNKNNNAFTAAA